MLLGIYFTFLAFIQVVPPPPPPGGSELHSIIVVDGDEEINISNRDFRDAIEGGLCLYNDLYCSLEEILDALYTGELKVNRRNDLNRLWQLASNDEERLKVCQFAQSEKNTTSKKLRRKCRGFEVPIPVWSKIMLLLSLLIIWAYFSKLWAVKPFNYRRIISHYFFNIL